MRNVALKSGSGSLKADDLQAEDLSVKGTSGSVRLETFKRQLLISAPHPVIQT
ncbi:DUF4097 family beta strand repeat-containing protein [Bacillus licheniformis]|nr:DUF4097 family beta strand repeat-containing protein [Bacillus licheniformis]